jgi:hypothetical protein
MLFFIIYLCILTIAVFKLWYREVPIPPTEELSQSFIQKYHTKEPHKFKVGMTVSTNILNPKTIHPGYQMVRQQNFTGEENILLSFIHDHELVCIFERRNKITFQNQKATLTLIQGIPFSWSQAFKLSDRVVIVIQSDLLYIIEVFLNGDIISQTPLDVLPCNRVLILEIPDGTLIFYIRDGETEVAGRIFNFEIESVTQLNEKVVWVTFNDTDLLHIYMDYQEVDIFQCNTAEFVNQDLITDKGIFRWINDKWICVHKHINSVALEDNLFVRLFPRFLLVYRYNKLIQKLPLPKMNMNRKLFATESCLKIISNLGSNYSVLNLIRIQDFICYSKCGRNRFPIGIIEDITNDELSVTIHGLYKKQKVQANNSYFGYNDGTIGINENGHKLGYAIDDSTLFIDLSHRY